MDLGNSARPPVPQPSQGRQQKRPRQQPHGPSTTTLLSGMVTPTQSMEARSSSMDPAAVAASSQGGTSRPIYNVWNDTTKAQLFKWLERPGNYQMWKGARLRSGNESTSSSGLTKKSVTLLIFQFLDTLHIKKTPEHVMSKMRYIEKKFKDAEVFLQNTGEGITSNDKKIGITAIKDKVLSICPFYLRVKPFMAKSVAINPPYIGETGTNENIEDMLFGTSTSKGLYEDIANDMPSGHGLHEPHKPMPSERGPTSFDEDIEDGLNQHNVEDEIHEEEEPLPDQPCSQDTPPTAAGTQPPSASNQQQQQQRRKPKSIQQSIEDMLQQNHLLIERRLQMQAEQLQLQKEQSDKQIALEQRRLDLDFLRMNQQREEFLARDNLQREELRVRDLALQVELARLCRNP